MRRIRGIAAGEDPDDVGAPADLPVEAFLGLLDQIWRQSPFGKPVNARTSARAASRCAATVGSLPSMASVSRSYWACTEAASGWS